jgi:hypothetical protein
MNAMSFGAPTTADHLASRYTHRHPADEQEAAVLLAMQRAEPFPAEVAA